MVTPQTLFPVLAPLGFETVGAACCGTWRGYAVTVRGLQYSLFQLGFAVRVDKKNTVLNKTLKTALKAQLGKVFGGVVNQGNSLLFNLRFDEKSNLAEQFRVYAEAICQALAQNGVGPACTCAVCQGASPESLCLIDVFQPVHASCVQQKVVDAKDAAAENQQNGSYLTGTLGALLGALVGTIPTILLLLLSDTISAFLFALVPLAAMFGYRLFKGKSDTVSIVIIVIISILSVGFIALACIIWEIMDMFGCNLFQAFSLIGYMLDWNDFFDILGSFWKGFLFMGLGIFISWSYLSKTNSTQTQNAEAQLSTLRPNPAFAQQADYAQSGSYDPYQQ